MSGPAAAPLRGRSRRTRRLGFLAGALLVSALAFETGIGIIAGVRPGLIFLSAVLDTILVLFPAGLAIAIGRAARRPSRRSTVELAAFAAALAAIEAHYLFVTVPGIRLTSAMGFEPLFERGRVTALGWVVELTRLLLFLCGFAAGRYLGRSQDGRVRVGAIGRPIAEGRLAGGRTSARLRR